MADRTETIPSHDGDAFDGFVFEPATHNGKAIVLVQEIFGVVGYIEAVAARLNQIGYLVLVPDMYWRLERGVRLDPPDEQLETAMKFASGFDWELGVADCGSALAHLRSMHGGRTGVVGFCFGGTLSFGTAVANDPDFAVSYYGSGVPDAIDGLDQVTCPLLLHFGGSDPFISTEAIERVRRRVGAREDVEMHVHPGATHAFDNHESATFHHPEASRRAWELTTEFLSRRG